MTKFFEQCVDRYLELTGLDRSELRGKKPFLFPGMDESFIKESDFEEAGELLI